MTFQDWFPVGISMFWKQSYSTTATAFHLAVIKKLLTSTGSTEVLPGACSQSSKAKVKENAATNRPKTRIKKKAQKVVFSVTSLWMLMCPDIGLIAEIRMNAVYVYINRQLAAQWCSG